MIKVVYAMGDACPIPVVKTKQAIAEMNGSGLVQTMVDNMIAVQNIMKMAGQLGFESDYDQIDSNEFRVIVHVQHDSRTNLSEQLQSISDDAFSCENPNQEAVGPAKKVKVVVISSETMGDGNHQLGSNLMKAFIYALSTQDEAPDKLIFYNGGVRLACEGSNSLEDLNTLKELGCEIYACGTCLNFYGLTEKLAVGQITNMYEIVTMQMGADLIIKP